MSGKKSDKRTLRNVDFWSKRISCWDLTHCPEPVRNDCPAYHNRRYPCWEIEGTYCKWVEWGTLGLDTETCLVCTVYLTYGKGTPIRLILRGKGIKLLVRR